METAFKRVETLAGAARKAERKQRAEINITRLKKAKEEDLTPDQPVFILSCALF